MNRRGTKGTRGRQDELPPADFLVLRQKYPPRDPVQLQDEFAAAKGCPASPPTAKQVRFDSPTGATDAEGRFLWWLELARLGIFVKQAYAGTTYEQYWNAVAFPGSQGQAVVRTDRCTLLWMPTGRVNSPNATSETEKMLRIAFPPFDAQAAGNAFAPPAASIEFRPRPAPLRFEPN